MVIADGALIEQRGRITETFARQLTLRYGDITDPARLAELTEGVVGLAVTLQPLRSEQLEAMSSSLRVIGRAGVGLDTIDLAAAERLGISVINQPSYAVNEVASHAVAMLLALHRKLAFSDRFVRDGWRGRPMLTPIKPIDELTVGLIGLGRIGTATARMLSAIVGRVLAYDPELTQGREGAVLVSSLDELLAESDAISLHTPLTPVTDRLIDESMLARMRPGALLVNVARGAVVDEAALVAALESGHISAAGLDVFAVEPLVPGSPLTKAPNTMLSPHCASYSDRSSWRLASWTMEDILTWVTGGSVQHGDVVVRGAR